MVKININYKLIDRPWGGGNQFLRSLKNYFASQGIYENNPFKTDAVLFNSHHRLLMALWMKFLFPQKAFIHRLDNLMAIARGKECGTDNSILFFNKKIADGTVFQSEWSKGRFFERGIEKGRPQKVIFNAPDPDIFYPKKGDGIKGKEKIRLISVSWSSNIRKGFPLYQFLDQMLDFKRFSMTFVGNSPVKFRNIRLLPPMQSRQLAETLRQHDVFISASLNESCPNALLEALHCGLAAVAIDSGAHKELIGGRGLLFTGKDDLLRSIEEVSSNIHYYKGGEVSPDIKRVGSEYRDFCVFVLSKPERKRVSFSECIVITCKAAIKKYCCH